MTVCENCVTLWHGTSTANAAAILNYGFSAPDLPDLAERVARRYGLSREQVYPNDSFISTTRRGDRDTYFTPMFAHAVGYASHVGEAEGIMLCYAYGHLHGTEPEWGGHDPERDAWVRHQSVIRHQSVSGPSLIEITLPRSALDPAQRNELEQRDRMLSLGVEPSLDILLSASVVNPCSARATEVDFCLCDLRSRSRSACYSTRCVVCRELKAAEIGDTPVDEVDGDDWFMCPPALTRLNGQPSAVAEATLACPHT